MIKSEVVPGAAISAAASSDKAGVRLLSLDALRGFDMFWIVGAEEIVHALLKVDQSGPIRFLANQLTHKDWQGFAFYDLIFPLFIFITGVSLTFSLSKRMAQQGRAAAAWHVISRGVLLVLLGIFFYGGFSTRFSEIRLMGVLQRIGLCYLFAGLAFCFLRLRSQVALWVGLLVGYWALLTFVPVPGIGAGNFAEGQNLANYIDRQYLPLRKWDTTHDPEGLLSTLPAIATCLSGVFAGMLLRQAVIPAQRKVLFLVGAGLISLLLGWLWHLQLPVIKKIWTSSFVLVAGGYSCLLLALFYEIIDIWKWRLWSKPFVWIGTNALTIYVVHNLVDFEAIAQRLVGGQLNAYFGRFGQLVIAAMVIFLTFAFCRFLYRRQIFLKL